MIRRRKMPSAKPARQEADAHRDDATRRAKGSGSLFQRNGWYYFQQTTEDGRVFKRSCKTKDLAEAEKAAEEFSIGKGLPTKARVAALKEFLAPEEENPTLDEAFGRYREHPQNASQSEGAGRDDASAWNYLLRWLYGLHVVGGRRNCAAAHPNVKNLNDITPTIATQFIQDAAKESSPHTLNRYVRIFKRVWLFNAMSKNPWADFRKFPEENRQRRTLTRQEVDLMIRHARGEYRTLFMLGPYTGLRLGDCAKIRWDYFSADLKTISLKPHKTLRSSMKTVDIPTHPSLLKALKTLVPKKTGFVLPSLALLKKADLSKEVQRHFRECGLYEAETVKGYRKKAIKVGFHSYRSYFISEMAYAGAPLAMVQAIVGHVSPELTQLYYRQNTDLARKFVNRI